MFAFYTTLKQEERSWQLWIKKLINMLTVKFQLAGLPCHPVLLWLHISSSTNAFSFRSTTIRSSRVHHGFTTTSEKKTVGSWNWFYLGFAWFTWFTIDSKISTSPWLCCIFALRWNGRWKSLLIWKTSLSIVVERWNWTNTKNKNPQAHRDEFSWNPGKIIDPNIPSAFLQVMHHRNHSFPWELTFENEANVEDSMLQVIDLPLAVGCLVNIYIFNPLLSEATFPPTPK